MQYAKNSQKARKVRREKEEAGEHIPPFLIASITRECNLRCKGCYARANQSCHDIHGAESGVLSETEWGEIFHQAAELGISFILLAGGEPFVRKEVLKKAGQQKHILFPVFTNGTLMDAERIELLEQNRNLIPILSIEGNQETTDARRGDGIYRKLQDTMELLKKHGILFGASVTVHRENQKEAVSKSFVDSLAKAGCKGIVYVEYVPVDRATKQLAFTDENRETFLEELACLRREYEDMVMIAFPGDEKSSGGCLAAGRGFFHINASGGAEPCPFSPYSDTSLRKVSLEEALRSPLFLRLQENGNLMSKHIGGCVLFEQEAQVKGLLEGVEK